MSKKILFAQQEDENELREILLGYGMDISGDIEEHLVLKEDEKVLAGGKLSELQERHFYLELIGVKQGCQGQGLGGILLDEMIKNPWKSCKYPLSEQDPEQGFVITTIARGEAAGFYQKYGFAPCTFAEIPEPYREQCIDCPDREQCGEIPMIFIGGRK